MEATPYLPQSLPLVEVQVLSEETLPALAREQSWEVLVVVELLTLIL
jgi:hypothetical protein